MHDGTLLPGLGGEGAVRGRRAGALGSRGLLLSRDRPRRPPDRTLFDGVFQVPPGHYLLATRAACRILTATGISTTRRRRRTGRRPRRASYVERVSRTSLDEAVRLRLRADVPVGCYLSGGLDSCAVLGLAARHTRDPIRAFTLTFDRAEYDEGDDRPRDGRARRAPSSIPFPIRQADLADHFADAIWQAETLCFNAHGVAKYLLSRAVRDAGYKVVLTGEGSDEILGGYAHFRRDMLLYNTRGPGSGRRCDGCWRSWRRANPVSRGLLLPDGEARPLDRRRSSRSASCPTWSESVRRHGRKPAARLCATTSPASSRAATAAACFLNQLDVPRPARRARAGATSRCTSGPRPILPNYILSVLGDRMEMAHSVEGRVPFLDHHVVECLRQIPVSLKIRGMTEKYRAARGGAPRPHRHGVPPRRSTRSFRRP